MAKRTANKLTHKTLMADIARLRATDQAATFGDGNGLYLIVTPAGRARFMHRFRWQGRAAERWLPGDYPNELALTEARDIRDADRKLLRDGINPIVAAKSRFALSKGVPTFAEYAKAHADFLAPNRRNGQVSWLRQMTGEDTKGVTVGKLAGMPIDSISMDDVKTVIAPLWFCHPTTAKEVCGRIRRVLDHRQVNARPDDDRVNPADFERIERAIGRKYEAHHKSRVALDYEKVPAFLGKLSERPQLSARALEMVIATGCRVNSILNARWDFIDWRARTLTIPAWLMKAEHDTHGEAHVVPLSLTMVRILRRAMPATGYKPTDLIFPNSKRKPFHGRDILGIVKEVSGDATVTTHGFRTSLMGWGTAMDHRARPAFDRDLMDVVLAHKLGGNVQQAYLRDRWLARRRIVMREWSRYCVPPAAVVLPFRKAA